MSFGDFLRDAMQKAGVSNTELASYFGVSSQAVSQWRAGTTLPNSARIEQVRSYLEDKLERKNLSTAVMPDFPPLTTRNPPNYVAVPTLDIRVGAGGGGIVDKTFLGEPRYFEEGFVRQELRAAPEDLCLVEIEGQSMEPLLRHGDTVLIDRRKTNISMEGIFVIFDGDGVVCKWIERDHQKDVPTLRIRSENPKFKDYDVLAENSQILGRVVWFGRRL